jgi:hypothetical protein
VVEGTDGIWTDWLELGIDRTCIVGEERRARGQNWETFADVWERPDPYL